ncbi:MAG: hypothetical protein KF860_17160 [Cyclobacteriaceae bacterium]|nr:hypothetical protein [Cyclobacteriaceae bacterium]
MDCDKLEKGYYVEIRDRMMGSSYYKVLEVYNNKDYVKVKNLHNQAEVDVRLDFIRPIETKSHHLEKIGFQKVQVKIELAEGEWFKEQFVLGDIEICDFVLPIIYGDNQKGYYGNGFTPVKWPLDYTKLAKGFHPNSIYPNDSFKTDYPSLDYINALFEYLDKKGVEYDKTEVVLTEFSVGNYFA